MIRSIILAGVLGLGAVAAQAQATPEQVQKLVEVIAANGCVVNADNNAKILTDAGLQGQDAQVVVNALLGLGQAEIVDGNLKLKTPECN
jgi:hypothetical protein